MKTLLFFLIFAFSVSVTAVAAPASRKPVVREGMVIRTQQQDAELRDWIVGLQKENELNGQRADQAEASEVQVRAALSQASQRADELQKQINIVTADRNAQARLKDAAMGERDYWQAKHGEAVKKLWWWRLWAGGAILVGVLLIAGGLLMRFTKWGAQTLGPLVSKTFL